jgi:hypothetical protein
LVELQQVREQLVEKTESHQRNIKDTFDRRVKGNIFKAWDLVLKWDATRQEKGKHGKFDALWIGPLIISSVQHNNTFFLQNMEGEEVTGGPFNGCFLKLYFS